MRALIMLFLVFSQHAYSGVLEDNLGRCLDKASATQEITSCYTDATNSWDGELNNEYKITLSTLSDPQKNKLKNHRPHGSNTEMITMISFASTTIKMEVYGPILLRKKEWIS